MIAVHLKRLGRCESGASAVEFSIVIVPMLLLIFGTIEVGRYMWTRTALNETAMAAARCMGVKQPSCTASGSYSSTQTTSFVQATASGWSISVPSTGITLNNSATCSGLSNFSRVTLAYSFQSAVAGLLPGLFGGGRSIQADACFPNQT